MTAEATRLTKKQQAIHPCSDINVDKRKEKSQQKKRKR
jgi:hypothetical protein